MNPHQQYELGAMSAIDLDNISELIERIDAIDNQMRKSNYSDQEYFFLRSERDSLEYRLTEVRRGFTIEALRQEIQRRTTTLH